MRAEFSVTELVIVVFLLVFPPGRTKALVSCLRDLELLHVLLGYHVLITNLWIS